MQKKSVKLFSKRQDSLNLEHTRKFTFSMKATSLSIIFNLVISMFAFAFIIYSASVVSAGVDPFGLKSGTNLKSYDGKSYTLEGSSSFGGGDYTYNLRDTSSGEIVHLSSNEFTNKISSVQSSTPQINGGPQGPPPAQTKPTSGAGVAGSALQITGLAGQLKPKVGVGGASSPAFQYPSGTDTYSFSKGAKTYTGSDGQTAIQATVTDSTGATRTEWVTTDKLDPNVAKYTPDPTGDGGTLSVVDHYETIKDPVTGAEAKQPVWTDTKLNTAANAKGYEDPFGLGISLGTGSGGFAAFNLLQGLMWAGVAVGVIQMLGGLLGADQNLINALSYSAFAGIMAGKTAYALFGTGAEGEAGGLVSNGLSSGLAAGIGIAVGLLIFALTYKTSSSEAINFQCKVWQPPKGGADCEKCNLDTKNFPCTEYKCRSLGGACQLLNKGTGEEKCAWIDARDVTSPIITPNYENISEGYQYANVHIRPPGLGFEIKNTNTTGNEVGCVEAFYPLQFGISTNEPTRCRIDYNHTKSFDDMQYDFGGSSTYDYNHTEKLSLPGPANINNDSTLGPEIKNDGVYNLFARCEDPNGNSNVDEFAIKFCVRPGPDTTPAKIESTSLINGMPISFGTDTLNMTVYTNEPADCKWSHEDKDYGVMENTMSCARSVTEFNANMWYACNGQLNGIKDREDNNFYFRCKDQPQAQEADRNVNTESYKFTVSGTQPLNILRTGPNGTIMGSTSIVPVTLEVETANGYKDGDATCYFSTTGNDNDYVKFFETGSFIHRQRQDLTRGDYLYYFKCVDHGGNADYNKTRFRVEVDDQPPRVIRVNHDSGESSVCGAAGCIKITTDEESTCVYSTTTCNYEIVNGIKMPYDMTKTHYAEWNTDFNYYIKCTDKAGNEPTPTTCSMTIKAYNNKW